MLELQVILNAIGYSIIPTLAALYITKTIEGNIKSSFDEKLEILKKEHSKENYKFVKLHEERFNVLKKTYSYLNKSLESLRFCINPAKYVPHDKSQEEYETELDEKYRTIHLEFVDYYSENKIYYDTAIEELLHNYFLETIEIYGDYHQKALKKAFGLKPDAETFSKAALAYKKIPEKIEPIKKEIEIKFRELLGD